MLINVIMSLAMILLSGNFYNTNNDFLGLLFLILGGIFLIGYEVILGCNLYKKLNKKNTTFISIMSLVLFTIIYVLYYCILNKYIKLDISMYKLILNIFYISIFTIITIFGLIFYYWNQNKLKKNIIYYIAISITVLLTLLLSKMIFKFLPAYILGMINFSYIVDLILLSIYVIVTVMHKMIIIK